MLVHVQDCRNGIFPSERAVQPLQVVGTPFVQSALVLHFHHVLMCSRKHDADCPHLVGRYLPLDACRADAVVDCLGAVCHTIGELHQLTVEAGACMVSVLGDGLTFDVVGCARVRRAFRLVELDAYVSHVRLLFL